MPVVPRRFDIDYPAELQKIRVPYPQAIQANFAHFPRSLIIHAERRAFLIFLTILEYQLRTKINKRAMAL